MSAPSVLVLGMKGMLGQTVFRYLRDRGMNVHGTQFSDPDAPGYLDAEADPSLWLPVLDGFHYAINCIGILKSAIRETESASLSAAIRVNALFPHSLAAIARERGLRIIHISTDGVYAGRGEVPYVETDPPDSQDHYGRTKALGESPESCVLNIRCSIIGRDAVKQKGLLEWLLKQPDGSEIPGFTGQLWNGATTLQFAQLCGSLIADGTFDAVRKVSGVHHLCPNPAITKYELLRAWSAVTGKRVNVIPCTGASGQSRLLGTNYHDLPAPAPMGDWPEILGALL